jgi:hypothetical protein
MKSIQPTPWTNTGLIAAQLNVTCVFDDWNTTRTYNWVLFTADGHVVDSGTEQEAGDTYTPLLPSLQYPYTFVANAKGLTLISNN